MQEETKMIEGDEWKQGRFDEQREAWNKPEKVALDEYVSIIQAHCDHVLRPVVQQGKKLDRTAVALTKNDLDWKIQNPDFGNLPLKTRDAYQNFMGFVEALENATDEDVEAFKDVLHGLFRLGISCHTYGGYGGMSDIYKGRNPCRDAQYSALGAVTKAGEMGESPLVDAARKMVGTCLKCPYK